MVALTGNDAVLDLYGSLMSETKFRLLWLIKETAPLKGLTQTEMSGITLDSWYLQLRRIAELVGIAVLVAHNTNPEFRSRNFVDQYNPDVLLTRMAKLNPNAYPQRSSAMASAAGAFVVGVADPDPRVGERLKSIYRTSADRIHTGSLRFIAKHREKPRIFTFVRDETEWLAQQLARHVVITPNGLLIHGDLGELSPQAPSNEGVYCHWLDLGSHGSS